MTDILYCLVVMISQCLYTDTSEDCGFLPRSSFLAYLAYLTLIDPTMFDYCDIK